MMKKTIFILTALAALACTAISCRKEFAEMRPGTGFTVTATIAGGGTAENGTKVSATDDGSSLALKWEQGDKLIGFDDATPRNTYGFEVTSVAGGKATLTRIEDGDENEKGTATTDPADGTTMYMLYVPGKTVADLNLNSPNDILNYDLSTQAENALPVSMTAQGTVNEGKLDLTFNVKTAIIGIRNPKMVSATTSSIILSSAAALNTKVTFSLDGGDLKATYGSGSAGTVTKAVSYTSATPTSNTYIVVCPVTSAADLTFTSNNGEAFTKTGKTVQSGKYYYMTPEFASMGREITVTFGSATSALFGESLTFDDTKKIRVSNESAWEDCAITVTGDGTTATITTGLDGDLTAVYPSTAAKMNGTNTNKIDGVLVSATQDGTPGGALAAKATITETAATAEFDNQTAVFKITLPSLTDDMTSLTIKSLPPASTTSRSGDKVAINTAGTGADVITVSGTITSGSTIYVSLVPGVKLCDLAFDATTGDYTGSMAGIPGSGSSATTAKNTLYTVEGANFHEYVQVGTVKWAKTNIGATTETGRGQYFAWGGTTGHETKASGFSSKSSSTISSAFTNNFAHLNTPYHGSGTGTGYTKYTSSGATLELMDDAAYVNWGGPWSMPASTDYTNLINAASTKNLVTTLTINTTDSYYGYQFTVNGKDIFFPAAGYVSGNTLNNAGSTSPELSGTVKHSCSYWSKTLDSSSSNFDNGYNFIVSVERTKTKASPTSPKSGPTTESNYRYYGMPIRPVSTY